MQEGRRVQIPLVVLGAASLWAIAVAMLGWVTVHGTENTTSMDEWAVFVAAAAAVWSVLAGQCLNRRKMAEAVVRRLLVQQETDRLSRI